MLARGNHALVAIFALSLTDLVVRQADAYSYVELGCAADAPGDDRVLPYGPMGIGGGDMSAEICYDLCADNYPDTEYFGTQFSWECFCGMTLPDDLSFDPEYDGCTSTCAGSTDGEICGGYYAVTVYQFSDFTIEPTPVPTPSVEPAGDYVKLGCAVDARGEGRVFPEGPLKTGGDMSAEICYDLCIHEFPGTDYFGTEFYDECFCGTTLPDGLSFDPEHDGCTTTCAGSTDGEICGGFDAITIYEVGGEAPTPVPTPDPTSGGPTIGPTPGEAPTPVPTPDPTGGGPTIGPTPVEAPTPFPTPSAEPTGDYVKLGCAVDARGDGRVLPEGPMGIGGGDMSAEICYGLCTRNYPDTEYFGTEFSWECFCGTTLPDGLSFDPEHDGCTTTCAGSTDGEICGGFNAITIYEMGGEAPTPVPTPDPTRDGHPTPAPPTTEVYVELGCSADPNPGPDGGRLMDAGPFRQSTMSAEICHDICMDELPYFEFFGTQWSIECFCSMAPLPDDVTFDYNGCTDTCAGSTTGEICGGTDAITVYPRWAT